MDGYHVYVIKLFEVPKITYVEDRAKAPDVTCFDSIGFYQIMWIRDSKTGPHASVWAKNILSQLYGIRM